MQTLGIKIKNRKSQPASQPVSQSAAATIGKQKPKTKTIIAPHFLHYFPLSPICRSRAGVERVSIEPQPEIQQHFPVGVPPCQMLMDGVVASFSSYSSSNFCVFAEHMFTDLLYVLQPSNHLLLLPPHWPHIVCVCVENVTRLSGDWFAFPFRHCRVHLWTQHAGYENKQMIPMAFYSELQLARR